MKTVKKFSASRRTVDKPSLDAKPGTWSRCARCNRLIQIKKTGQIYGLKCARIQAWLVNLDRMAHVGERVQRRKTALTKSEVMT